MKRHKKLTDWVRDAWLIERPEYASARELPIDQCTDAALEDMPIRFQDEARKTALRNAFKSVAESKGMRAIKRAKGQTIYGYVRDIETLFDLREYLAPLTRDVRGRQEAIRRLVEEWLEAHPAVDESVDDVLVMLDADVAEAA